MQYGMMTLALLAVAGLGCNAETILFTDFEEHTLGEPPDGDMPGAPAGDLSSYSGADDRITVVHDSFLDANGLRMWTDTSPASGDVSVTFFPRAPMKPAGLYSLEFSGYVPADEDGWNFSVVLRSADNGKRVLFMTLTFGPGATGLDVLHSDDFVDGLSSDEHFSVTALLSFAEQKTTRVSLFRNEVFAGSINDVAFENPATDLQSVNFKVSRLNSAIDRRMAVVLGEVSLINITGE